MIIDYEKNKKLQNKNREKYNLVIATSLISLGINNYSTFPIIDKTLMEVVINWKKFYKMY